jgi:hypothetical protein
MCLLQLNREVPDAMLIVPGTYHVEEFGRKANRAEFVTGDGIRHTHQDKLQFYSKASTRRGKVVKQVEDIGGSDEINLLLAGDALVGVAICKDFIDQIGSATWTNLDVSILLVPSMGDGKTRKGHVKSLDILRTRGRTTAAVAQETHTRGPVFWFGMYDGSKTSTRENGGGERSGSEGTLYACGCLYPR